MQPVDFTTGTVFTMYSEKTASAHDRAPSYLAAHNAYTGNVSLSSLFRRPFRRRFRRLRCVRDPARGIHFTDRRFVIACSGYFAAANVKT